MGEYPDFQTPDRDEQDRFADEAEPELSQQGKQEIAHARGRICKKRGCAVCAPLVERRRLKKKQRQAEAQELLHSKGQPCGRTSCSLAVCVGARDAAAVQAPPPEQPAGEGRYDGQHDDPDWVLRRQDERHRVGLPCGSEDCESRVCVEGFSNERIRRHRARRPCRSSKCDNAICVAGRSAN